MKKSNILINMRLSFNASGQTQINAKQTDMFWFLTLYTHCSQYSYNNGIKLKCITIISIRVPSTHFVRTALHGGFGHKRCEAIQKRIFIQKTCSFVQSVPAGSWSGNMCVVSLALHVHLLSQWSRLDEFRFVRAITERRIIGVLAAAQPHCRVFLRHKAEWGYALGFSLVGTVTERL